MFKNPDRRSYDYKTVIRYFSRFSFKRLNFPSNFVLMLIFINLTEIVIIDYTPTTIFIITMRVSTKHFI